MTALVLRPQFGHHRRSRVLDMHGATVTRLSEHRSLVSRYQESCRQADFLNASLGELWLRAYLASINYALVIAGLHAPTMERDRCPKKHDTPAELIRENTVRTIPDAPA